VSGGFFFIENFPSFNFLKPFIRLHQPLTPHPLWYPFQHMLWLSALIREHSFSFLASWDKKEKQLLGQKLWYILFRSLYTRQRNCSFFWYRPKIYFVVHNVD